MGIVQTFRLSHSIQASRISLLPVGPAGKSNPHQRQMGVEKVPFLALLLMKKCYDIAVSAPLFTSLHWLFVMIEPRLQLPESGRRFSRGVKIKISSIQLPCQVNDGDSSAEASAASGVNLASATIQLVVNHSSFISRESQKAAGAECTASPRSRQLWLSQSQDAPVNETETCDVRLFILRMMVQWWGTKKGCANIQRRM